MPRYRILVEYDGRPFAGWQIQTNAPTVQGVLTTAIAGFCGEAVLVQGAGRTDAGVHATGQVAHFDLARAQRCDRIRDGLTAHLRPHPVAVLQAEEVPDDFNARFSATRRHYLYRIVNRRPDLALDRGFAWRVPKPLDVGAMQTAARHLIGRHDFTTFRAAECQASSPVRTLDRLDVTRDADAVSIRASARSFLHNQVRSMVGSLVWVGEGRWAPDDMAGALHARSRGACGPVAPADGLYLTGVDY